MSKKNAITTRKQLDAAMLKELNRYCEETGVGTDHFNKDKADAWVTEFIDTRFPLLVVA
jgi:hypothetical protein